MQSSKNLLIFGYRPMRNVDYTLRMTNDRYEKIKYAADVKGVSISAFIFETIEKHCNDTVRKDTEYDEGRNV